MAREIGPDTIPDELLLKDADSPHGVGFAVVVAKDGKIGGVVIEKGDPVEQSLAAMLLLGVDEDSVQSLQAGSLRATEKRATGENVKLADHLGTLLASV